MRRNPLHLLLLSTLGFLGAANTAGSCGGTQPPEEIDTRVHLWDVTGNYDVTYDNQLKLTLNIGGAVRERTANGYGGIVDFGTHEGQPVTLDLTEYCAREDVHCPSEAFPARISISQTDNGWERDLYEIHAIDNDPHQLPPGVAPSRKGGIFNRADYNKFVIGLDGASGGEGNCGALAISLANGRFKREGEGFVDVTEYQDASGNVCTPADGGTSTDCNPVIVQRYQVPPGAKFDSVVDGKVALGWVGACAWGPFLAGASLTIETGYTAVRTGNFDPPAFIPADAGQ